MAPASVSLAGDQSAHQSVTDGPVLSSVAADAPMDLASAADVQCLSEGIVVS